MSRPFSKFMLQVKEYPELSTCANVARMPTFDISRYDLLKVFYVYHQLSISIVDRKMY